MPHCSTPGCSTPSRHSIQTRGRPVVVLSIDVCSHHYFSFPAAIPKGITTVVIMRWSRKCISKRDNLHSYWSQIYFWNISTRIISGIILSLLAKYFIHCCYWTKKLPDFNVYLLKIELYENIERLQALKQDSLRFHETKWCKYMNNKQ